MRNPSLIRVALAAAFLAVIPIACGPAATPLPPAPTSTPLPPLPTEEVVGPSDGSGVAGTQVGTEGGGTLQDFEATVQAAVTDRNFTLIRNLVGDPFVIAGWQSEGVELPVDQAISEMEARFLTPASTPVFLADTDLTALLGGMDPMAMWDPAVRVVDVLLSHGWGPEGIDQAMLVIAEDALPDGTPYWYWYALLYAPGGFAPQGDNISFREQFEQELIRAVVERDFDAMRAKMLDVFAIAGWRAGASESSPDDAIARLQNDFYPPADSIVTFGVSQDIEALLGQNPVDFFGGGVSFLHSIGWGQNGSGDAILTIDATPDGVLYWKGILFALDGFN